MYIYLYHVHVRIVYVLCTPGYVLCMYGHSQIRTESDWLVLTHGISPDFRHGGHLFLLSTAIGSVPSYQVTPLRTDGFHCRESAGTGPVVFKVL